MNFISCDIKWYNHIYEHFSYLFEADLINEICTNGQLRRFNEDDVLIDIGDVITHMPLVVSGSIKIMTEDKEEAELLKYYLELGE